MKCNRNILSCCILVAMLAVCFCAGASTSADKVNRPIVVLYENDVHCNIDNYTKISGLRNAILAADTADCAIVSSGDFIQGGAWGSVSRGEFIINMMNSVGYKAITIGNHEFDYGIPTLFHLASELNTPITCVNMCDTTNASFPFLPYIMTTIGSRKIAFVGAVTPSTEITEFYAFNGMPYSLNANKVYDMVQKAVDSARTNGADYVIVLSHLGEKNFNQTSVGLVNATHGIDCVLDGHTHSIIPDTLIVNDRGQMIPLSQTGSLFANIGKLYISTNGHFSTSLIPADSISYTDSKVTATRDSIAACIKDIMNEKVGSCDFDQIIADKNDYWFMRFSEGGLGDLITDAFAIREKCDIGLVNGGSIRNMIPAGEITYKNVINCLPFFNNMMRKLVPGSAFIKLLNASCSRMPREYGEFLQVSGLKFDVDLSGATPVVSNVMALNRSTGNYEPICPDKMYTVATTTFVGEVYKEIFGVYPSLSVGESIDTEELKLFISENLHGVVGTEYKNPQGRINIKIKGL